MKNRNEVLTAMLNGNNVTDMLLAIDKFYKLEAPIGSISKGIIINNLVPKYEHQIQVPKYVLVDELKAQPSLKGMFAVIDKYANLTDSFTDHNQKVRTANSLLNNFDSILTITRIPAR